jgi:hypothetical protein
MLHYFNGNWSMALHATRLGRPYIWRKVHNKSTQQPATRTSSDKGAEQGLFKILR